MAIYPNDMLHPTFLLGAIQERPDTNAIKQRYIGSSLLPFKDVPERRLTWDSMVSENNLAGVYSSKGHAIPGSDLMFSSHFADVIDIKASRYLDPDMVAKIREIGKPYFQTEAGESWAIRGIAERVKSHVSANLAWCDDAVDAQIEYLQMHALQGSIVWPPVDSTGSAISSPMPHWNADESLSVTMPLYSSFVQNVTTLSGYKSRAGGAVAWNNTSGSPNPVLDLEVIAELMAEEKGIDLMGARLIMSRSTLSYLATNASFLQYIWGKNYEQNGGRGFMDISTVKDFVSTKLGYNIETYDAQWTYREANAGSRPTIRRVKFLKEGKVLIIPKGADLGFFGVAPHETQDGSYRTGKIPWVHRADIPPYERQMGVGLVGFPILQRPEEHFVLDVYN